MTSLHQTISVTLLVVLLPFGEMLNVKKGSKMPWNQQKCTALENHEVYTSVKVAIGNPPQNFDLVADTGSDNCIVYDCSCKECPDAWGSCFTGPARSNSFKLPMFKVDEHNPNNVTTAPASMVMRFGSDDISTKIASDEVQIGPLKVYMENGLLLMVDQALSLTGHFEGILGLGRPPDRERANLAKVQVPGFLERAHVQRFSMCFNHNAPGVLGFGTPTHRKPLSSVGKAHWSLNFHGITFGQENSKLSFCGSGVQCSIIPDSGTTLLVGPEEPILSIYEALCKSWERCNKMYEKLKKEMFHLAGAGIEVEGLEAQPKASLRLSPPEGLMATVAKLAARSGEDLSPTPVTPVNLTRLQDVKDVKDGADTLLPKKAQLGDKNESYEVSPGMTLRLLLQHCTDWMSQVDINAEMPDLVFHVTDKNGNAEELKISPRSYVLAKTVDVEVPGVSNIFGMRLNTKHKERKQVCVMGFSPADYQTPTDGQIWILGMPLFYEYTAHYDRGNAPEEVTMGFTSQHDEACGQCDDNVIIRQESLLAEQARDVSKASVGLESLNTLSRKPIIRDLSDIDHL